MDIALKQRLVGATILIALAVIFLPLLLDGENRDGQATQPIEIPERPNVDFKTRRLPIGDHGQTDEPTRDAGATAENIQPAPEKPVEAPANEIPEEPVASEPEPVIDEVSGNWLVQVGSFGSLDNANRLEKELDALGYVVMLETTASDTGSLVRVKIGPFESEHEASQAAQSVRSAIPSVRPRLISADGNSRTTSTGASGWVVQLGSFSTSENAAKLASRLRQQGFTVFTNSLSSPRGTVYKVRTSPLAERAEAEQLRDRIRVKSSVAGMLINLADQ